MDESLWSIVTIGGPIILALAILFAILNNRRSKSEEARTESATLENYERQDAADKRNAH